jgi:hypothetical protein
MATRMALEQFTEHLRHMVKSFEAHWKNEHAKDPKNWPLTQPSKGDWEDQFLAWVETKGES